MHFVISFTAMKQNFEFNYYFQEFRISVVSYCILYFEISLDAILFHKSSYYSKSVILSFFNAYFIYHIIRNKMEII